MAVIPHTDGVGEALRSGQRLRAEQPAARSSTWRAVYDLSPALGHVRGGRRQDPGTEDKISAKTGSSPSSSTPRATRSGYIRWDESQGIRKTELRDGTCQESYISRSLPTIRRGQSSSMKRCSAGNRRIERDGPQNYWLAMTGEEGQPGINGAITGRGEPTTVVVNTMDVASVRSSSIAQSHRGWGRRCC